MSRYRKALSISAFLFSLCVGRATASCSSSVPYVFVATSPLSYVTTNANNNFLVTCATTIDNTQIGSAGIYASQIIPTNPSQATFGSSQNYSFQNSLSWGSGSVGGTLYGPGNGSNSGAVIFTGNLGVGGVTTTSGIVDNGTATVNGNTTMNGNLGVSGGVTTAGLVNSSVSTLNGPTTINNTLGVTGGITTAGFVNGGSATFNGSTAVNGPLSVTGGITTFVLTNSGATSLNAPVTVNSTLNVTGGTTTAGMVNNGTLTNNGLLFGTQVQASTGGVNSQVLPAIIAGSAINNQTNAHFQSVDFTLNGSGSTTVGLTTFDATPRCTATYTGVGVLPTTTNMLQVNASTTSADIYGFPGYTGTLNCVGS